MSLPPFYTVSLHSSSIVSFCTPHWLYDFITISPSTSSRPFHSLFSSSPLSLSIYSFIYLFFIPFFFWVFSNLFIFNRRTHPESISWPNWQPQGGVETVAQCFSCLFFIVVIKNGDSFYFEEFVDLVSIIFIYFFTFCLYYFCSFLLGGNWISWRKVRSKH